MAGHQRGSLYFSYFMAKFKTAKVYIYKEHKKCLGNLVGLLYCLVFRFPGTLKFVALLIISHLLREDVMKLFDGKDNKYPSIGRMQRNYLMERITSIFQLSSRFHKLGECSGKY